MTEPAGTSAYAAGRSTPVGERTATPQVQFGDIVSEVAAEFGVEPSDEEINHILWEHTGFPGFWQGDPVTDCARQVRSFYQHQHDSEWRCGDCPDHEEAIRGAGWGPTAPHSDQDSSLTVPSTAAHLPSDPAALPGTPQIVRCPRCGRDKWKYLGSDRPGVEPLCAPCTHEQAQQDADDNGTMDRGDLG